METIYKNISLVRLSFEKYKVVPMKKHSTFFTAYRCEEGEEDHYSVMAVDESEIEIQTASFSDQDKAHQFAELLTECLNKIKTFTDETKEQ